jgi:hypothetical protein
MESVRGTCGIFCNSAWLATSQSHMRVESAASLKIRSGCRFSPSWHGLTKARKVAKIWWKAGLKLVRTRSLAFHLAETGLALRVGNAQAILTQTVEVESDRLFHTVFDLDADREHDPET